MTKDAKPGLTLDEDLIRKLAALLDETGLGEIELEEGDSKVRVAKPRASAPVAAVAPPAPSTPVPTLDDGDVPEDLAAHPGAVTAPMVGVCYLAADPKSPPFCSEGTVVKQGDTLLLIEAMKVFNPIVATKSGTVTRILVDDGTPVEYGEPLVIIE